MLKKLSMMFDWYDDELKQMAALAQWKMPSTQHVKLHIQWTYK